MFRDNQNIDKAKNIFRKLARTKGYDDIYIENQIEFLFNLEQGFRERFKFFLPHIKLKDKKSLLVSGSAVGAELLIAKEVGFKKITGVEVSSYYKETADVFTKGKGVETLIYDGESLPFEDRSFSMAISCHVVEHTKSPKIYLAELIRVLKDNSVIFIEYPDRNNPVELHTGTKSFEKYPKIIRDIILSVLAIAPFLPPSKREKYKSVRDTLRQISLKDINKIFNQLDVKYKLITQTEPAPGIIRLLYRVKIS